MKILILNYEYPPIGGGGGVISKYIAEILASRDHHITVLSTWFHTLKEEEHKSNLRIIRVKSRRVSSFRSNPIEMLSWIWESKKVLNEIAVQEKFDLTLANFALPGGEVAYYLKRKFNIPYAVLSHGHDIPWVKPYRTLLPLHLLAYKRLKTICLESEKNFIQSPEMRENINRFTGPLVSSKNKLIPNGVDSELFRPEKRKYELLEIIFVGRLVAQKDPLTLLKAIRIFSKTNNNFNLSIYGDGPLRKKLEDYVDQHGLRKEVAFLGKVDNDELVNVYKRANLMIAPSMSEGMSISILEALASGVFVISTKVSGNTELISEDLNGFFVPEGNPLELSDAIGKYYRKKFLKCYAIPEGDLDSFRSKYDWGNIVSKYEVELQSVANSII